eukprot:m.129112 g.129112  ORF g.129112 m.129112 type:complete len:204 (+) comp19928_c0_seq2:1367-1978(+)
MECVSLPSSLVLLVSSHSSAFSPGSPSYMAPEVYLQEQSYGTGVDMWALGVVTYIVLCGHPPFGMSGLDNTELFRRVCAVEFSFPDQLFADVSVHGKNFICSLLVLDPSRRLAANQALDCEWITQRDCLPSHNRADSLGQSLRINFVGPRARWRSSIIKVCAMNRLRRGSRRCQLPAMLLLGRRESTGQLPAMLPALCEEDLE